MSSAAWFASGTGAVAVTLALAPAVRRSRAGATGGRTPSSGGQDLSGEPAQPDHRPVETPRFRPRRSATLVLAVPVLVVLVVGGPPAGVGTGVALVVGRVAVVRRTRRLRTLEVASAIPELIDLFAIAAAAGHPVRTCLDLVADRAPAPVRPSLEGACVRVRRGVPLAAALGEVGERLGPAGAPLVEALVSGLATGAPLGPALARASEAARDARRRRAEEAARRLPVTLLFPLVCCVLPAFGLLAVVPLLAASLASLRT
ncbi:hypothetical protein BH10ACT1_BH10ACT1_32370 [soil metagenome]